MNKQYQYSQDWFSHNIEGLKVMMAQLPDNKLFLEVGSYEGRSTCWFLENGLADDGAIFCYDTWEGSEEHSAAQSKDLYQKFNHNIELAKKPTQSVYSYMGKSVETIRRQNLEFDFVYIDGSHQAPDVLMDACLTFRMLKKGGIMVFDDYLWKDMPGVLHQPKIAIDAFVNIFSEQIETVMIGYQYGIKKL
jgi:predicted O-methyltransferase YrrM